MKPFTETDRQTMTEKYRQRNRVRQTDGQTETQRDKDKEKELTFLGRSERHLARCLPPLGENPTDVSPENIH